MTGAAPRLTSTGFMMRAPAMPGKADRAGGLDHRAAAHQRVGRLHVGMEVAVVVEVRHLGAQQRAHGLQRRAGAQRRMEVAALRGGEQFDADDGGRRSRPSASSRRAPCAAIETWSSWLAEVGIESTLAG